LSQFQEDLLTVIIKQRLVHYPLQYIIGRWSFFGHEFFVGPGVLIPRADTETVMDVCMEYLAGDKEYKVLDLCAGTGCIGISIAAERENVKVTLVEKYSEALTYLNKNVEHNGVGVEVVQGDVLEGCASDKKYDLIVSNPPYITDGDMKTLQAEVQQEPETALAGGKDGLDFYRAIIENYKESLCSGGMLVFEVGVNQASAVALMMTAAGFMNVDTRADMNDIDRVVFGTAGTL
ncbi:MAG: peptide chain release factor N(5)-glutamine methyltransferase, partial [Clostridia bacterium]|nr:peptide chain release factor N(5)-glutamine methyltransferase [Clostridia bacterium]